MVFQGLLSRLSNGFFCWLETLWSMWVQWLWHCSGSPSSLDEHLHRNHCIKLYLKNVSSKCSEQGQVSIRSGLKFTAEKRKGEDYKMQGVVLLIHLISNHFISNDRGSKRTKGGEQGIPTASCLMAESVHRVLTRSVYNKKIRLHIPVSFPTMESKRSTVIKCPMKWSWTSIKK